MTKRQRWDMPKDVWNSLTDHKVEKNYQERPQYQQNDYIGWINQAKRPETREKRVQQMVDELKAGNVYMKMPWGNSKPAKGTSKKAATIEEYIANSGELLADVILALDECLKTINSDYTSKAAWGGWAYLVDSNYSCMIVRYKDHVKLMIWRGIMLNDPKKILQGAGSNTQHIRFESVNDVDCDYLKMLLMQQFRLYDSGVKWEE